MPTPSQLVAEIQDLVSFPEAAVRIIEVVDDAESSARDLAQALSLDPALSARVLRLANSAYYSAGPPADTIERAVNVLGRRKMRDMTIGISAIRAFEDIPMEVISMDDFWSHSLHCAVIGDVIARAGGRRNTDSAFVAGLLHDIGQLVLFMRAPKEARRALMRVAEAGDEITTAQAENEIFGFDHMAVGEQLAHAWRLPRSLTEPIAYHHRPAAATVYKETVAIVHIANSLAVLAETGSVDLDDAPPINDSAWRLAGVSPADVPALLQQATEQFADVTNVLFNQ